MLECPNICKSCNKIKECTLCYPSFYLDSETCKPCHNKCLSCFGAQVSECTSCIDSYYLNNNNNCLSC